MRILSICSVFMTLTITGCIDRNVSKTEISPFPAAVLEVQVEANRKLDILFVVDDSSSMENEQESLAEHFVRLINEIETVEHGLPDLHIGVVSTDLGVGEGNEIGSCTSKGLAGELQSEPRVAGCSGPSDRFIVDRLDAGGERIRNYDGELSDAFACIAQLGDDGCGFEQPLEAMKRALDGGIAANDGFLRDDARLAVIFITDEDDCSASDRAVFNTNDPSLGSWEHGFRCFDYGVVCDQDAREEGPHANCRPREDSPYLADVNGYVDFLRSLKRYPDRDVMVAGIVGRDADMIMVNLQQDNPKVAQSCFIDQDDTQGAFPPVRLRAFFDAFEFHKQTDICTPDLADALEEIGDFIGPPPEGTCLPGGLLDTRTGEPGTQPNCVVTEVRDPYTEFEEQTLIDACDNPTDPQASSVLPCYTLTSVPQCPGQDALLMEAQYAPGENVPTGTVLIAHCEIE